LKIKKGGPIRKSRFQTGSTIQELSEEESHNIGRKRLKGLPHQKEVLTDLSFRGKDKI
jgi:hypothetical protein